MNWPQPRYLSLTLWPLQALAYPCAQFIARLMPSSDAGYTALVEKGGGHQAGDVAFSDKGCPFCLQGPSP